jgi:hypothetical protein
MIKTVNKPIYSKIILKLESSFDCNFLKKSILNLALQNNLIITSKKNLFIDLKKRNKIAVTVLSGPHVHKKSREQLAISKYSSFLEFKIKNTPKGEDFKSFLIFKDKLKTLSNHSVNISFTYLTSEQFIL